MKKQSTIRKQQHVLLIEPKQPAHSRRRSAMVDLRREASMKNYIFLLKTTHHIILQTNR